MLLMLCAFEIPIINMLYISITNPSPSLVHYRELFNSPVYLQVLAETFKIAAITTAVCILLGYPLAYWLTTLSRRAQLIGVTFVILPFWVSILVRTYAWIIILGFNGVVNRFLLDTALVGSPIQLIFNTSGVIVGTTHVLLPFMVLPLYASMTRFDWQLLRAGTSLGATPGKVFWQIYLPLTVRALAVGVLLVFILSLGFFVTPAILGGGRVSMVSNVLDMLINQAPQWELAAALSTLLLVMCLLCFAIYQRIGGLDR